MDTSCTHKNTDDRQGNGHMYTHKKTTRVETNIIKCERSVMLEHTQTLSGINHTNTHTARSDLDA